MGNFFVNMNLAELTGESLSRVTVGRIRVSHRIVDTTDNYIFPLETPVTFIDGVAGVFLPADATPTGYYFTLIVDQLGLSWNFAKQAASADVDLAAIVDVSLPVSPAVSALTIGTVTTGDTPSVTLVGSALNFVLPGGDSGSPPDSVSGLVGWYKADAITGLSHGGAVTTWNDSSGGARHLTQATSGKRPTYITTTSLFNGLPCVRFAGTDDTLANTAVTGISAVAGMTVITVSRLTSSGTADIMHLDNGAGVSMVRVHYEGTEYRSEAAGGIATGSALASRRASINSTHYNGSVVTALRGTSAHASATGAGTVTTTRIFMGSYRDSANYLIGDVAEVCIYNKALSASEREAVIKHLADKYQLAPAA